MKASRSRNCCRRPDSPQRHEEHKGKTEMRPRNGVVAFCLISLCSLCLCGESSAQLPHVRLDRTFPLGGAAGSQVTLELTGKDLDDVRTLHFDRPGFQAEPVKPNQFRVTVAADVPAGTYEVRAVGKYGISGGRLFAVSRGLT